MCERNVGDTSGTVVMSNFVPPSEPQICVHLMSTKYRMVAYRQPDNLVLKPPERQELLLIRTQIQPPEIKAGDPMVCVSAAWHCTSAAR